jgi:NAD(P)-dependent dehydrogenase (short-subunit alcohol dehydrogenase family)
VRALRGKTAVVTGAASGIGRALALRLHRARMRLVLADIDRQRVEELARQIPGSVPVRTDVSRAAQVEALAETAYRACGAVHLLCNNAGIADSGPIWEMPLPRLRRVIDVDLWGAIHGCRAFVPRMLRQPGEAHVVNVSSMAGLVTPPGASAYSIAKHGVVALSEALAQDLEASDARIGVSVVCPGWVRTSLGDESRDPLMRALIARGTDAADVAEQIVAAVRDDRFYVLTHPELAAAVRNRARDIALGRRPSVPLVRRSAARRRRATSR